MSGLPKEKQYQYNHNGKFIKEYESRAEVLKVYNLTKGNFYGQNEYRKEYRKMPDGTFIANYKIGRDKLKKLERIANCKFCNVKKDAKNKPVEVFNLLGEKLAEYKSMHIAHLMTGIDKKTLYSRLNESKKEFKNKPTKDNLTFKYKN